MWPAWRQSHAPSMYTTRSSGPGTLRGENCAIFVDVAIKSEPLVNRDVSAATDALAAAVCTPSALASIASMQASIREIRSVVDTPCVRLTSLYMPAALTSA
eukprot:Amastigsp_a343318_194.p3 type:complete len:101 gc:universal Amastigsp_a343318_194:470-772(+)